jgi:hypothetical protein
MKATWWFAVSLVLVACTEPRRLVLSIDTNAGIPCDIDHIQIRASAAGTTMFERSLDSAKLPIIVTLLDDTPSGSFTLDVTGLKGGVEVARVSGPLQFSSHEVTQSVMLDVTCGDDRSCPLSEAMSAGSAAPSSPARFQCGGPTVRRYAASTTSEGFVDACDVPVPHSGKVLMTGTQKTARLDDLHSVLPDFGFKFYGEPIHQIWVSRDGYISFGRDDPDPKGDLVPGPLDRNIEPLPPPHSVFVFWDTITLGADGICYDLEGPPKAQRLRVTWRQACLTSSCSPGNLDFTITLDESTQRVVVSYAIANPTDADKGGHATVGIFDEARACPADQCKLDTGLCQDGVTPCGYSQVFSRMVQANGVPNMQFAPVVE